MWNKARIAFWDFPKILQIELNLEMHFYFFQLIYWIPIAEHEVMYLSGKPARHVIQALKTFTAILCVLKKILQLPSMLEMLGNTF